MAVTRTASLLVAAVLFGPGLARAQTPATQPAATQPAELVPPHPLVDTTVPYPEGAPAQAAPVVVKVKILVGADGVVKKVELTDHTLPAFDDAVVRAAQGFRFEPATYGGRPVPVEISFTQTFEPPPPPAETLPAGDEGPPRVAVLKGRLREMGTRAPVEGATVVALVGDRHYLADADTGGRFRLPLPAGTARVTVHAPGYNPFLQEEHLDKDQELAVTYLVERERYDPYEIVVVGETPREEVSRVTPDPPRGRLGHVAPAVPRRARSEPELDGVPPRRHACAVALPPPVGAERHPPRVH